jgi:hypothetical protein
MATMLQTSVFLPMVLPQATTCPAFIAEQNIRLAAIDFCARTLLWKETITQAMATATETIDIPPYARVVKIVAASVDGEELSPARASDIPPGDVPVSVPSYYFQRAPGEISLYPFQACDLTTTVALQPRVGQEFGRDPEDTMQDYYNQVPDFLFIDHAELIAAGALARILAVPKRDYTNLQMAGVFAARFEAGVGSLSAYGVQGQQRAPLRSKPHWL